ncbi:hypothetical protein PISMIDRAFT_680578 [Pisolithus microcarpus 441]|uniref:Uncharacterized protein n=1 Tax=Pisolithus microcarpus 441 TaxID=765257 RepID=A0A0C9ZIA3_9AGAM|nr:hypothetical protein PISMIDRAFT_680578 [Pisolithus microcarpus 441]
MSLLPRNGKPIWAEAEEGLVSTPPGSHEVVMVNVVTLVFYLGWNVERNLKRGTKKNTQSSSVKSICSWSITAPRVYVRGCLQ